MGGAGRSGRGGGIYLAGGKLILKDTAISHNLAVGGAGGAGGAAAQLAGQTKVSGGATGGTGASATGGGLYVAGGTVQGSGAAFTSNAAIGGQGGTGGKGGLGGVGGGGGAGGAGGPGGSGFGGGIYLRQGTLTLDGGQVAGNQAVGGAGGPGGSGGAGSSLVATSNISIPGVTQTKSGSVVIPTGSSLLNGTGLSRLFHGGPGGAGGTGGPGGNGSGGGVYVAGGTLTIATTPIAGNQAVGGQGGTGGKGGQAGMAALIAGIGGGSTGQVGLSGSGGSGAAAPAPLGGLGGAGGSGGSGDGGGLYLSAGIVTLLNDTASGDSALGGAGGPGGTGGAGAFAGGLSGLGGAGGGGGSNTGTGTGGAGAGARTPTHVGGSRLHVRHQTSAGGSTDVGGFATGGDGGDGGDAGNSLGGGLYVAGGSLSLGQDTIATNAVAGGAGGASGLAGEGGSYGLGNGQKGQGGADGSGSAGAVYVHGGSVSLSNDTIALNSQSGNGSVAGVLQAGGTVKAVSTLFAGNGTIDYSGALAATDSLVQAPASTARITGSANKTGIDPKLATAGLAANGGPTRTILLQAGSPALGSGSNPESFATDQRGYGPRTGAGGTDIGAVQLNAAPLTAAPTAALGAADVVGTSAAAAYEFTVTYTDVAAIEVSTLADAVVQVVPPGGTTPIAAAIVATEAVGATDPSGNAPSFVVTYQIMPPGGTWSAADDGTYGVTLGGSPVKDVAGTPVPAGTLGSFAVNIPSVDHLAITASPAGSSPILAGSSFTVEVSIEDGQGQVQAGYSGSVTIALASGPVGAAISGTETLSVSHGVATFSGLAIGLAGAGYSIRFTSASLAPVTTGTFSVVPAAASQLVITTQPPKSVTAGQTFSVGVSVEDAHDNVVTDYKGTVQLALAAAQGTASLGGTTSLAVVDGVANFTGLFVLAVDTSDTVQAAAAGLTGATTSAFSVVAPTGGQTSLDTPSQVVITASPTSTTPMSAGASFSIAVALEDSRGVVQTGYNGPVTIALVSGPGGGTLGGTMTVQASHGIATFTGLTIGQAAGDYTIRLSSGNVPTAATLTLDVAATTSSGGGGSSAGGGGSTTGGGSSAGGGSTTGGGSSAGGGGPSTGGGSSLTGAGGPTTGGGSSNNNPSSGTSAGGATGSNSAGNPGGSGSTHKAAKKGSKATGKHGHVVHGHKAPSRPPGHGHKAPTRPPGHSHKSKSKLVSASIPPRDGALVGSLVDIRSHPLLLRNLSPGERT